jgi:hypothetical protein
MLRLCKSLTLPLPSFVQQQSKEEAILSDAPSLVPSDAPSTTPSDFPSAMPSALSSEGLFVEKSIETKKSVRTVHLPVISTWRNCAF